MATRITPLPTPVPQSSDPENFDLRADAFLTALPTFANEANQVAEDVDAAVDTASAAANAALSNAGFVGRWEDQSGSAAPPYSVFHGGLFWSLLEPVADVAASEPEPFNTHWAVTGAPAWYNNFAVGDYLDTARSPGAGWLRRNGAAYPKSSYPELAPLMPSIPEAFVFNPIESGTTENLRELVQWGDLLVAWQSGIGTPTQHIYYSADDGETWQSKQIFMSPRELFSGCVFNDELLIGTDQSQYLRFTDIDSFSLATIPGVSTDRRVGLGASPTAVVAVLNIGSGTQLLRRTTNLSSWTEPTAQTPVPASTTVSWARGTFAVRGAMISLDDGATFTLHPAASVGQPLTIGNISKIFDVNGQIISPTAWWESGSGLSRRPSLIFIDDASTSATIFQNDDMEARGYDSFAIVHVDGKYLWFLSQTSGSKVAYSMNLDTDPWTPQGGAPFVNAAVVVGPWVVTVGPSGSITRGRFIDSEAFRVPNDNPAAGWIKAVSDSAGTVGYAGVPEAPLTGGPFARQGGAWVPGAGGVPEAPNDGTPYARESETWVALGNLATKDSVEVADIDATGGPDGTKALFGDGTWKVPSGGGGGMVYPGAGIAVSTGSAWDTSKTAPSGALVGTTDTQTLTNKTLGASTKESVTTGSTITINDAAAPFQQITLTGNVTATINLSVGVSRTVWVNPGSYTVTWPVGTVWAGGSAPSLPASKWSLITLTGMPSNTDGMAALVGSQP